jgi:hypothetical protein
VAQRAPGATFSIVVTYTSGSSLAAGLVPNTADARGAVSWTWVVGGRPTLGRWPVDAACEAGGQRFTARTTFIAV